MNLFFFQRKPFCVIFEMFYFMQQHSANDAPLDGVHFIRAEIDTGGFVQLI